MPVSGISAVVKVVGSHLCEWGSIPGKSCSFFIVSLSKGLSLCFMCSDEHVKYWMPRWLSLTSSLLLDCYTIHTHALTSITRGGLRLKHFNMLLKTNLSFTSLLVTLRQDIHTISRSTSFSNRTQQLKCNAVIKNK